MNVIRVLLVLSLALWSVMGQDGPCTTPQCEAYYKVRDKLVQSEDAYRFDKGIVLSDKEQAVDKVLQQLKEVETEAFLANFPPSMNFREARSIIDSQSKVFPLIQAMPKGAILHLHSPMDAAFVFNYATYRSDCYINVGQSNDFFLTGSFSFSENGTPPNANGTVWKNVIQLRSAARNKTQFDIELFNTLQFFTPANGTEDAMWVNFDHVIQRLSSLIQYLPIYEVAFKQALGKLWDDGVFHVELRGHPTVYLANGRHLSPAEGLDLLKRLVAEFNQENNTTMTLRVIGSVLRRGGETTVYDSLVQVVQLRRNYSDFLVGFDLVDEEDRYHRLIYYLEDFFKIEQYIARNHDKPLPYFFHAGETAWTEGKSEMNLYDALLLNTTRIGHGYALKNHPLLTQMVKTRGIALEVCPISNQMLKLVGDLRNHPANIFAAEGVPFTLSPDDPNIYGYTGVSYDFYEAYMSWDISLKGLKQLALNSIIYSALDATTKQFQLNYLNSQWNNWIDYVHKLLI